LTMCVMWYAAAYHTTHSQAHP